MSIRLALALALVVCGAWLASIGRDDSSGPSRSRPRHLVLVTIDTLSASRVGSLGYELDTTPHLDALARRGVTFEAHSTAFNATYPSLVSIQTGLYARDHGHYLAFPVRHDRDAECSDVPETLAMRLRTEGFWCAAVGSHPLWGEAPHDAVLFRGFEHLALLDDPIPLAERREHANAAWTAPEVERALDRWALEARGKPLFLWAHYFDPHGEPVPLRYSPPSTTRDEFVEPNLRRAGLGHLSSELIGLDAAARAAYVAAFPSGEEERAALTHALVLANYDAEVRAADDALARLCTALDERGLLADALLVVCSDHGENLSEARERTRDAFTHAGLAEDVVRTPLVLSHHSLPRGLRVGWPTSNVDIAPTVLDLLGIDGLRRAAVVSGRSLVPSLLEQVPITRDAVFTECGGTGLVVRGPMLRRFDDVDPGSYTHDWRVDPRARCALPESDPRSVALAAVAARFRPAHELQLALEPAAVPRRTRLTLTMPAADVLRVPEELAVERLPNECVRFSMDDTIDTPRRLGIALRRSATLCALELEIDGVEAPERHIVLGRTRAEDSGAGWILRPGTLRRAGAPVSLSFGASLVLELAAESEHGVTLAARTPGAPRFVFDAERSHGCSTVVVAPGGLGLCAVIGGPSRLVLADSRPGEPMHVAILRAGRWPAREALALDGRAPEPGFGGVSLTIDAAVLALAYAEPGTLAPGDVGLGFAHPAQGSKHERGAAGSDLDRALRALGY